MQYLNTYTDLHAHPVNLLLLLRSQTSVAYLKAAYMMEPECVCSHRKCNWDLPAAIKDVVKPRDVRYAPVIMLAAAKRMACDVQRPLRIN